MKSVFLLLALGMIFIAIPDKTTYQEAVHFVWEQNRYAWRGSWPANQYIHQNSAGPEIMLHLPSSAEVSYKASSGDQTAIDWQTGEEPRHW